MAVLRHRAGLRQGSGIKREASLRRGGSERLGKRLLDRPERHPILRPLRAGKAGHDRGDVKRQSRRKLGRGGGGGAEQPLLLHVALDELDLRVRSAGEAEVGERLVVDREESHRRPVLRRHVRDRRPIGKRHPGKPRPVKLDKLPHHTGLAEDLGDGEDEIGGGGAGGEPAGELKSDHLGEEQRQRLAEHHRLRLDAADAPANDAEAVDHRRVAVGADERVGNGDGKRLRAMGGRIVTEKDAAGEVFEVHLMNDPDRRRDDAEVLECLLPPAEEGVALGITLELDGDVLFERPVGAEVVDLDGVVDDEIDRHQWVDLPRVSPQPAHRRAHRSEIDDARHAGEVLEDDARRLEGNLRLRRLGSVPRCQGADVGFGHLVIVAGPQQRLEDHPNRIREPGGVGHPRVVERPQPVERGRPGAGLERATGGERIDGTGGHWRGSGAVRRWMGQDVPNVSATPPPGEEPGSPVCPGRNVRIVQEIGTTGENSRFRREKTFDTGAEVGYSLEVASAVRQPAPPSKCFSSAAVPPQRPTPR